MFVILIELVTPAMIESVEHLVRAHTTFFGSMPISVRCAAISSRDKAGQTDVRPSAVASTSDVAGVVSNRVVAHGGRDIGDGAGEDLVPHGTASKLT